MKELTPEQLEDIRQNCRHWANNCGGCETCAREFSDPPLYDFEETATLLLMIEARDKRIKELQYALEQTFRQLYPNPMDDE